MFAGLEISKNAFGIDEDTHISYAIPVEVLNGSIEYAYFLYKQKGNIIDKPFLVIFRDPFTKEITAMVRAKEFNDICNIEHVSEIIPKSTYVGSPFKENEIERIQNETLFKSFLSEGGKDENDYKDLENYAKYILEMELENLHPYYKVIGKHFFFEYGK